MNKLKSIILAASALLVGASCNDQTTWTLKMFLLKEATPY